MRNDMLFEVPTSHETYEYNNSYTNPEFEDEWELAGDGEYGDPEFEDEWELSGHASYNTPYANPEFEDEWELSGDGEYGDPEFEDEWETSDPYGNGNLEFEDQGEYELFKKIGRFFKKAGRFIKKRVLPKVAGAAVSMFPGGGLFRNVAEKATKAVLKEADMEVAQMEAEFFGNNEADPEVGQTDAAREAVLAEFLAGQAANAKTDAEADALLSAALPATISSMGAKRLLSPVQPVLIISFARMSRALNDEGAIGKQLRRTMPAIQRDAVATLKAQARAGEPITGQKAARAAGTSAARVLGNPRKAEKAVKRNVVLTKKAQKPTAATQRRPAGIRESAPHCPTCGSVN